MVKAYRWLRWILELLFHKHLILKLLLWKDKLQTMVQHGLTLIPIITTEPKLKQIKTNYSIAKLIENLFLIKILS